MISANNAITDFETFINKSINNDISQEIEAILRSSNGLETPCTLWPLTATSASTAAAIPSTNASFDPHYSKLDVRQTKPFVPRHIIGDSNTSPQIDALSAKISDMQRQIDNLASATGSSASNTPHIINTQQKKPTTSTNGNIPSSKLDDVWKELRELRQLVVTASNAPKPKHDAEIMDSLIRPEIARELARMDVRFTQRLERIKLDGNGGSGNHHYSKEDDVDGNMGNHTHYYSRESPSIRTIEEQNSTTIQTFDENDSSESIHWEKTPHSNRKEAFLPSPSTSSAERELHDLMERLKLDLDQQQTKSKKGGVQVGRASINTRQQPSHRTPSMTLVKQHSYTQPTFSSRLKSRGTPVWK
ncbi:hypothetical protein BDR26DRAFT_874222 [Obelidium mucronatum]|nr:hypothetical protein BDR26DRAFT_874222 [Obelidium mucronatum]